VLRPVSRAKIERRLTEVVGFIIMRAAVEESRGGPRVEVVIRADDVGAGKWIAPGACVSLQPSKVLLMCLHARKLHVYGTSDYNDVPQAVCGATWSYA